MNWSLQTSINMEINFITIDLTLSSRMKTWFSACLIASLIMLLLFRYSLIQGPLGQSYVPHPLPNSSNPLEWVIFTAPPAAQIPLHLSPVVSSDFSLFAHKNITNEEQESFKTWNLMKNLINHSQLLPHGIEAIREAGNAWNSLMASLEAEKLTYLNNTSNQKAKLKQCPHFLNKMNASELDSGYTMRFPCGLTQGSAITIIGTPNGPLGNFRIDLTGETVAEEPDPPIILHYNVRLHGDQITEDPVIVQNTWTKAHDWGEEDRCPTPFPEKNNHKVDELDQCNKLVGRNGSLQSSAIRHSPMIPDIFKGKDYFPFKPGYPFVATLRVGSEGMQMTVDGKHITSFAYRETLEPWLVSEIKISGDLKLISILASGLPTSEELEHAIDVEALKSPPFSIEKTIDLFIGVFSNANNFKRRIAVRRTWMQYPQVRGGNVVVRFFVGLVHAAFHRLLQEELVIVLRYILALQHKNQIVNAELWNEARTYGDIQLMPFVDYYSLITWKTLGICTFGTRLVSAKFVVKTDDDSFVRIDEVLASLKRINLSRGLLYGLIESSSQPQRDTDSKWYISPEEWREEKYPPWAHGPGYVVSQDIAKEVYERHKKDRLKMFKLEDVAMGIWISEIGKDGLKIRYENDERVYSMGCKDGYVVAHYQSARDMLCLWQKLQDGKGAKCCGEQKG